MRDESSYVKRKSKDKQKKDEGNQNAHDPSLEIDGNITFPILELCIMNTSSDAFSLCSHFNF